MKKLDLSLKYRLLASLWLSTALVMGGFFVFIGHWYERSQLERLDSFLANEAGSVVSALGTFLDLEPGPRAGIFAKKEVAEYLDTYLTQRGHKPVPFKTTLVLVDTEGNLIARSNLALDLQEDFGKPTVQDSFLFTHFGPDFNFRSIRLPIFSRATIVGELRIACLLNVVTDAALEFQQWLLLVLLVVLGLLTLGSQVIVNLVLRPVGEMTRVVNSVGRTNLHTRVPLLPGNDELARLAQTLNRTLGTIEEAWKYQNEFITAVSHQIRTPLAALRGSLELGIIKDLSPEEEKQVLVGSLESCDHLVELVNSLLHLARLDSTDTGTLLPLDLSALLEKVLQDLQFLWAEQDININLEAGKKYTVLGDERRLSQVFMNILDNAARFVPRGGAISIKLEGRDQDGKAWVAISLENNGPSLPEEHLETIFTRFFRLPGQDHDQTVSGFGLGLSIARRIVELHCGTLVAYNPAQGGAGFLILLPSIS